MKTKPVGRLVVCGVGLIGGSFALALKAAGMVREVVGIGRSRVSLERALALGVIDRIAADWGDALAGAEVVLLAMPVGQTEAVVKAMAPHLAPGTLVTDAGSTKRNVIEAFYLHLEPHLAHTVPGHPIAGAEKSGCEAADATLFRDRKVVLTPLPENEPGSVLRVKSRNPPAAYSKSCSAFARSARSCTSA